MNGFQLPNVASIKYLGVILEENGGLKSDIARTTNSFLRQFNALYSKFHYMDRNILYFLFKTYTSSFYAIELWFGKIPISHLDKISIPYHKAVKRICGLNVWNSNHDACDIVGVSMFRHLMAKRIICFWYNLCMAKSPCVANLNYYLRYNSIMFLKVKELFEDKYTVDISSNPLCAILARIDFVQRHEPRSHYV